MKRLYICTIFVLLLSTLSFLPPSVSAAPTERLFTHKYIDDGERFSASQIVIADVLADGQFLVVADSSRMERGYMLMKMDTENITLTKFFGSGDIRYAQELGLIFFLNEQTKRLEVYNESLQLVATENIQNYVPESFDSQRIYFYVHNEYISFHFESYAYRGEPIVYNDSFLSGFIYNTAQKKVSTHAQFPALPIDDIKYSNAYIFNQIDALGRVKKQLHYYTPTEDEVNDVRLFSINTPSITVGAQYHFPQQYTLSSINTEGQILHTHTLYGKYAAVPSNYHNYDATQTRIFSLDESSYYNYNNETHTLSERQPLPIWLTYTDVSPLNNDFYYFRNDGELLITPNTTVEPLYKVTGDFITAQSEKFAIASTSRYNHGRLFNVEDGTVLQVFDKSAFKFIGEDYLAVLQRDYDEYSFNFTISIHALQPESAVASTKTWTVTFSDDINPTTVTTNTVYVTNAQHQKQAVTLRVQDDKLFVDAPPSAYNRGNYTLHINGVTSKAGRALQQSVSHNFSIQ